MNELVVDVAQTPVVLGFPEPFRARIPQYDGGLPKVWARLLGVGLLVSCFCCGRVNFGNDLFDHFFNRFDLSGFF